MTPDTVITTAEVRWFFCGPVPVDMHTWFVERHALMPLTPPRVDHYLLIRDTDALGVKFREGRLEVKQRVGASRQVALEGDRGGVVERWCKWGFPLAPSAATGEPFDALDAWIAVEKRRRQYEYRLDSEGVPVPSACPDLTIPMCSVELTDVLSQGRKAWTLAFEASGPAEVLEPILEQVANHVLATCPNCGLRFENSFGYPRWLQRVHA